MLVAPEVRRGPGKCISRMINALLLLLDPTNTWEKIAQRSPGVARVFFTYLFPLMLVGVAVETWALMKVGQDQGQGGFIERRVKVTQEVALRYAAAQVGFGIVIAFLGAWMLKGVAQGFHRQHTYSGAFATLGYSLGPYYLLRVLDAAPFMNTWICWGIGAVLTLSLLYRAVPRLMRPDPSNALGVYLMGSLLTLVLLGVSHFLAVLTLDEKILTKLHIPI
jgi:hypothetical protein